MDSIPCNYHGFLKSFSFSYLGSGIKSDWKFGFRNFSISNAKDRYKCKVHVGLHEAARLLEEVLVPLLLVQQHKPGLRVAVGGRGLLAAAAR